jgi:hypothetical protein
VALPRHIHPHFCWLNILGETPHGKIPSSWLRATISVWTSSIKSSMMPCSITRDEPGAFGSVFQTSHMELEAPILRHRQAGSQCITGFRSKDRLRSQLRVPPELKCLLRSNALLCLCGESKPTRGRFTGWPLEGGSPYPQHGRHRNRGTVSLAHN